MPGWMLALIVIYRDSELLYRRSDVSGISFTSAADYYLDRYFVGLLCFVAAGGRKSLDVFVLGFFAWNQRGAANLSLSEFLSAAPIR